MQSLLRKAMFGAATLAAAALATCPASACGGFFCNQAQPVNQAAERIIFADNGDGTVTAVIQIQYQGPSQNFSWLLPISSVPKSDADIGIASNLAFQRLQGATNPNYTLTTRVEGVCRTDTRGASGTGGATSIGGGPVFQGPDASAGNGGVTVEASGVVGAFEWTVISLDTSLTEPADVATKWLKENGYDVPSGASQLLGPYLEDGLYLLALRLTKGADSGSIRPIVLTYTGTKASIPIKLTAVAANDDMGVMTWVLGDARAVPENYFSLELNEARINWFNANANYNAVVTEAANDASGHGFVTEFAGKSSALSQMIWTAGDEATWTALKGQIYSSFSEFFDQFYGTYGSWDGFWDATRESVTLPKGVAFEDFKLCPSCYSASVQFSPSTYLAALEKDVIAPVKVVQTLIDAHPELTRLYSTLSADEMTEDPEFTFNADLADVSNLHTAERVIECNPNLYQFEAPWRVELPQGDVVRGTAADFQSRQWPSGVSDLPPNRRIVHSAGSGSGKVFEDNSAAITTTLEAYNSTVPAGPVATGGASGSGGAKASGGIGNSGGGAGGAVVTPGAHVDGGGCNLGGADSPLSAAFAAAGLIAAVLRRRRSAR
jgi:hypothetical protein